MGKASEDYKVTALSFRFVRPLKGQVRPFPSPKWTQTPQQLQCTGSAVTILQTCLLKRRVGLEGEQWGQRQDNLTKEWKSFSADIIKSHVMFLTSAGPI